MPTKLEFAQTIKQKYPQYASIPDADLADKVLAKYPQYQSDITPDASEGGGGWGPTIARVATPVLGGIAGSFVGPAGTIAGGSGGAMLGETIAQFLEGKGYRPWQIGAQGVIGAIPIPGASAEAPFLKQIVGQAVKGAGLGAGATALSAAAEGQTPTAKDLAMSAGIGAFLGGGTHAVFAPHPVNVSHAAVPIPELEAINAARNGTSASPSMFGKVKAGATNLIEQFQNRLIKPDLATKALMKEAGQSFAPGESPFDMSRIAGGEGAGRAAQAVYPLREAMANAEKSGLGREVQDWLDISGMKAGLNTLEKRAQKLESGAYQSGREANVNAMDYTANAPPTNQEVKLTDRLKAISEQDYNKAESIRRGVEGGKVLPEGLNPDRLQAISLQKEMELGPERFAQVKQLAQPVFDFNKETASKLHEYGFITPERLAELHANEGYIPLMREIDDQVANILAHGEPIHIPSPKGLKVLKGSDLATMDPYEASLLKRQIIEHEGGRNKAVNAFTSFADKDPSFKRFAIDITGNPSKLPAGYDVIEGFKDGVKHTWAMPTEIANSLKLLNETNAGILAKTLSWSGGFFQRLATVANAGFAATNPIRDVMDIALLNPKTNILDAPKFLYDWLSIFGKNLKHDLVGGRNLGREEFLKSGAAYSTNQRNITPKMQLSLRRGEGSFIDKLFRPIEMLSANTEETSKMAMAKLLEQKGIRGNEAIINIRDFGGSPDFAVKGAAAGAMNALIPFFNASMQGIARNIKGIKTMSPVRASSLLVGAAGLELARDQWNSQFVDKDGIPSQERMTDNDKQNYFTFITPNVDPKTGRHTSIKLSKGHAARILFNPIADTIAAVKYGKGSVGQIVGDEVSQFAPGNINFKSDHPVKSVAEGLTSSLNPAIKGPIEEAANKNMFTGAPIVAKRLEGLPPGMQSTDQTNPVWKRAGEQMNVSPARLQHLVQTFIPGTTGELGTELANRGMGESKGSLFGSVTRRFEGSQSDQYKQNMERVFYDELTKTDQVVQGLNKLKKTEPAKVRQYVADNLQALQRRTALTKVADRLGQLRNLPDEKASPLELQTLQMAMKLLGRDVKSGPGNPNARRFTKEEIDKLYEQYRNQ